MKNKVNLATFTESFANIELCIAVINNILNVKQDIPDNDVFFFHLSEALSFLTESKQIIKDIVGKEYEKYEKDSDSIDYCADQLGNEAEKLRLLLIIKEATTDELSLFLLRNRKKLTEEDKLTDNVSKLISRLDKFEEEVYSAV